jgi:acyl carrier protein
VTDTAPSDGVDRLAAALLARIVALFHLEPVAPSALDESVFGEESHGIGGRTLDSLDVALLIVTLEEELGTRLADRDDLSEVQTLRGFAGLAAGRCNAGALEAFCAKWAPATWAAPPG